MTIPLTNSAIIFTFKTLKHKQILELPLEHALILSQLFRVQSERTLILSQHPHPVKVRPHPVTTLLHPVSEPTHLVTCALYKNDTSHTYKLKKLRHHSDTALLLHLKQKMTTTIL